MGLDRDGHEADRLSPDRLRHRLDPETHQRIFENEIVPDLFAGSAPSERPIGVVFGGQPGSGKSQLVDATLAALETEGGAVGIIGDDLRAYHPAYARLLEEDDATAAFFTDADSGAWVEKGIERAVRRRASVVIEGTMRDAAKVSATMRMLRKEGYRVEAHVLVVKAEVSWQGVLERYHAQKASRGAGRMTTAEAHQAAYDGLMPTVAALEEGALADVLGLHRRGGSLIYENTLVEGRWSKPMGARDTIERERRRRPTAQELSDLIEGYDRVRGHLERSIDLRSETAAFVERRRAVAAAKLERLRDRRGKLRVSTAGQSGPGI